MNWRVVIRPEVESDVAKVARWYESQQPGLGAEFVEAIIQVWAKLAENPQLNIRRHRRKDIRWQYPERFPYRVIYEISEAEHTVIVAAVLHGARHDKHWRKRVHLA